MNIKDIVKDNYVEFDRYRQNHIYYSIFFQGSGYKFPVPLEDIEDATLERTMKAITLMRYIRKALDDGTFTPFGCGALE